MPHQMGTPTEIVAYRRDALMRPRRTKSSSINVPILGEHASHPAVARRGRHLGSFPRAGRGPLNGGSNYDAAVTNTICALSREMQCTDPMSDTRLMAKGIA